MGQSFFSQKDLGEEERPWGKERGASDETAETDADTWEV